MSAPVKLAAFAAILAVLFGGGALAGALVGPEPDEPRADAAGHGDDAKAEPAGDGHAAGADEEAAHAEGSDAPAAAHPVRGLAVAENGLRLVVATPELARGRTETLRFRIVDDRDRTVRDFDVEHEKRMHLILARRDLTGFQHLHPRQGADGAWSVAVRVDDPGSYRVFADFARDGEPSTLAADVRVDGAADLRPLPAAAPVARSDGGYDVRLDAGGVRPGREADLRFTISRDGTAVDPEPYLGAGGHLVALREGDLAFLHVHPTDDHGAAFAATFPTAGRYRLFLQFKHEGRVQTAAFTQEVR